MYILHHFNFTAMNTEVEDVDYLTYVDTLLSRVEQLQNRLDSISYTKPSSVPTLRPGRPLKFGKPSRVFSVRLPVDFVSIFIESCVREGISPSQYIIKYLDLH